MLSIGWQMATAHALSAGLTVLVWSAMAGALHEICELPDQPCLAVGDRHGRLVGDVGLGRSCGGRLAFGCLKARAAAGTFAAERLTCS